MRDAWNNLKMKDDRAWSYMRSNYLMMTAIEEWKQRRQEGKDSSW